MHFFVRPLIGGPFASARAELETPCGTASSGWKKGDGKVVMDIIVPSNTTATIEFPNGRKPETVSAGSHRFELELKQRHGSAGAVKNCIILKEMPQPVVSTVVWLTRRKQKGSARSRPL